MTGTRRWALCLVLVSVAGACAAHELWARDSADVVVNISTNKEVYYLGETVEITVIIRNTGDATVEIAEPAIDRRSLNIEIVQPDGTSDRMLAIAGLKLSPVRLAAKRRVRFSASFVPERLGKFTINVTYNGFRDKVLAAEPKTVFVVNKQQ